MADTTAKIVLTAVNKTDAAFNAAKKNLGDIGDTAKKTLAGIAAGAAGLTALGVGIAALAVSTTATTRELQVNADMAGVGVEAYQELEYAASRYRITQEALTDGLKELNLRADEFVTTGAGSAAESFKRLGFNAAEVNSLLGDTPALLEEVARRMQGLGEAAQIRIADELFGGQGGEQFKEMLSDGAEGIARLRTEARNLGLVLGADMVEEAEAVNNSFDRMHRIVSVNVQRVLIQLAPTIENLAISFANAAPSITEFADSVIKLFFGVEALSLEGLRKELQDTTEELAAVSLATTQYTDEQLKADQKLREGFLDRITRLKAEKQSLEDLIKVREKEQEARKALFANDNQPPPVLGAQMFDAQIQAYNDWRQQQLSLEFEMQDEMLRTREEYYASLEGQVELHLARMNKREAWAAEVNRQIWESGAQGRLAITQSVFGDLAVLMQTNSKKMFEVGKAAAIGETVIQTYKAAQEAFSALAGIPIVGPALGAAAAAAAIAAGFARVQAIKSTSFGGGGSASAGGGGGGVGSAPSPGVQDVPALAPPSNDNGPVPNINIHFQGSGRYTYEEVLEGIVPLLDEVYKDSGYNLRSA